LAQLWLLLQFAELDLDPLLNRWIKVLIIGLDQGFGPYQSILSWLGHLECSEVDLFLFAGCGSTDL